MPLKQLIHPLVHLIYDILDGQADVCRKVGTSILDHFTFFTEKSLDDGSNKR